jgi:sulfate adenylyltransferase subunit 1 (EFTu-like GTPase family)
MVLKLDRRVSVDRYRATGGFVLLDPETYDTIGIGIVEAADSLRGREANPAAVSGQRLIKRQLGRASESRLRSAAKALTWRIVASLTASRSRSRSPAASASPARWRWWT